MVTLITILHVFVCLFLILVVLLQAGKGGGMGLAFGSTGANTVFGGSGAGNFLTKLTAGTAVMFMLTSLSLAYFASGNEKSSFETLEQKINQENRRKQAAEERLRAAQPDAGPAVAPPVDKMEPVDKIETPPATPPASSGAASSAAKPAAAPASSAKPAAAPASSAKP